MLGAYVRALVKGDAHEFLRFVALHHIAYNIWPDLGRESSEKLEDRGRKMLVALVAQANNDVVRDIVTYRQKVGEGVLSPLCFEAEGQDWKAQRNVWITGLGYDALKERLTPLLR